MSAQEYYKGAYRITIQGVPVRVTVKPTPHMLALWRLSPESCGNFGWSPDPAIEAYDKQQEARLRECAAAVDWTRSGYVHAAVCGLEAAGFSL